MSKAREYSRTMGLREDVSDALGISMDYTLELHQQYKHMVQEELNYENK